MSIVQRSCAIFVTVLLIDSCASDEPAVDRGSCERMRDHAIELRLQGVVDDLDAHRATARQVLGDGYVERCVAETSAAELECSLAAKSLQSLCAARAGRLRFAAGDTQVSNMHDHVRLRAGVGDSYEELPASKVRDLIRLDSSPITIMGLAAGDLIRVLDGGRFELVERGGVVAVQIFLKVAEGSEVEWMAAHCGLGAWLDSVRTRSFVVNYPESVGHRQVQDVMARFQGRYPMALWQYGNVYDETTTEPLEWSREFLSR